MIAVLTELLEGSILLRDNWESRKLCVLEGLCVGYDSDCWRNNDVDGGRNGNRKYSVLPGLTSADV